MIHLLSASLLRRHVSHRPESGVSTCEVLRSLDQCDSEVQDLRPTVFRDEHIGGLDISMNDTSLVSCTQCLGEVGGNRDRPINGYVAVVDDEVQRISAHVLHHHEIRAVDRFDGVNTHNVGVRKTRNGPGLTQEALPGCRIVPAGDEFQRNKTIQTRISREIHCTHPALTDLVGDLVV